MSEIEVFYKRIPSVETLSSGQLIPYLVFYCSKDGPTNSAEIRKCFETLQIAPYSNISSYLNGKANGKYALFIKDKSGYKLRRHIYEKISNELYDTIPIVISANLFDLSILDNTQYYLINMAKQMCGCYETGLYDACLVMMRQLLETLIIECFERFAIESQIKNTDGTFIFLKYLIPAYLNSNRWNASKNIISSMNKIKKYGDASAHNRRFIAKKPHLDDLKFELGQAVQEIVLLIDYPNWVKSKDTK
jgi:hypothetical protein